MIFFHEEYRQWYELTTAISKSKLRKRVAQITIWRCILLLVCTTPLHSMARSHMHISNLAGFFADIYYIWFLHLFLLAFKIVSLLDSLYDLPKVWKSYDFLIPIYFDCLDVITIWYWYWYIGIDTLILTQELYQFFWLWQKVEIPTTPKIIGILMENKLHF